MHEVVLGIKGHSGHVGHVGHWVVAKGEVTKDVVEFCGNGATE